MKSKTALVLLLAMLTVAAPAQKKKKDGLPAILNQARFVYVEAMDGDEYNPKIDPDDRQAIADVIDALREWNRYTLTVDRSHADLIVIVRTGRVASERVDLGAHRGPVQYPQSQGQKQSGVSVGSGTEFGPADDLLWVCTINPDGKLSTPLWRRTQKNGLQSPDVPLFLEFKDEVDRAFPQTTGAGSRKP